MARRYGFEVVQEGTRLRALRTGLEDPRFVLNGIGALLTTASAKAFREEKMGNVKWRTRAETGMVPNWPGILSDFAAGKAKPPDRRFHSQHTLTDTGRLRGSISWRIVGEDTVEVGSNVPYAKVLHEGGESETAQITKALQERMWKWMKGLQSRAGNAGTRLAKARRKGPDSYARAVKAVGKDAEQASMTKALGWLLNPHLQGQRLTVKHPARPLVGVPKDIRAEIGARYGQRVRGA